MEILYTNEKNVTTKYTEDMLISALKARDLFDKENQHLTETVCKLNDQIAGIRGEVFDFFNERYESGDSEVTCSVDDINELLDSIGSFLRLKNLYTVRATIDVYITGIEADSKDAAESEVHDWLNVDWGCSEGTLDEFSISIDRVESQ